MTMGEYIKFLRNKREWTQEELGKKLNPPVERPAINKWESGKVENIKRTYIEQMANLFQVKPSELMCFEETANEFIDTKEVYQIVTNTFGVQTSNLIKNFNELNEDGKRIVSENMDAMTHIPKYTDKI